MRREHEKIPANELRGGCGRGVRALVLTISALSLAACSEPSEESSSDGALHGELHVYRVNYLDGHSEREFYLAPDDESPADTRLIFAGDPLLDPWTRVRVWGSNTEAGFKVTRYDVEPVDPDVASTSAAILSPTKKTRTVGFVITDPTGSGTVNLTNANAQTALFGTRTATQAGLNQFYNEASYGGLNFTGEILGPVTVTTLGTCQQSAITQIENGWASQFGKTFQHWMTYLGQNYSSCGWSGIGGEGTAARPASGSWYNASTGCTVLAQEVGHNLGLMHSNSLRCSGATFADDPLTCTGAEYGNRHSVMGSGCAHLTAYDKWYEGFFQGCNAVRATTGTYTLLPTEIPCDGVQGLQIPMPKTRPFHNTQGTNTSVNLTKYYLELRTKTGIDANESAPTVLVLVGNDIPAATKYSEFSWVLDMNPSTTNAFDGMSKGQTFTDPAGGVSFTVTELDANHATVDVVVENGSGAPTCMDGTTFAPPGPASCGTSPGAGGSSGSGGGSAMGGSSTSGGTNGNGGSGMAGAPGNGGRASGGGGRGSGGAAGGMSRGGAAGSAGANSGRAGSSNGGANAGGATSNSGGSNNNSAGNSAAGSSSGGNNASGGSASGGSSQASGGANSNSSGGAATAGTSNTSAGKSNASGSGGSDAPVEGGCSCRTAPDEPHQGAWGIVGLLGIALAARRRR